MGQAGPAAAAQARTEARRLRVAFVVPCFPLVSETFIIEQVASLLDRGIEVDIYSFTRGDTAFVSQKFFDYDMASRLRDLDYPIPKISRVRAALPRALRLAVSHPGVFLRSLNLFRYGGTALSLKLLFWAAPLAGRDYDIVHCHFGTAARDFVWVRDVLRLRAGFVTTFYGIDVSKIFRDHGPEYYDSLKQACSLFFVMSHDMKRRVIAQGFAPDHVRVLPVSIDVDTYPYRERTLAPGEELRLLSVGRFVEKKGFDDLLRAMAIVKQSATRPVSCSLVGGGELEDELHRFHAELGLGDTVRFEGFKSVEEVVALFDRMHVLVQPSKTAANGDME